MIGLKWVFINDSEIDWGFEFGVYGLNLSTMQFENVSYITKDSVMILNMHKNSADYSEEMAELGKKKSADFLLYNDEHFCVGYVKIV